MNGGAYAAWLFKEADSDHDGKLTWEEFAKLPEIDRLFEVANFDYYDVNNQGYVTQADFVNRPNPAYAALDQDKSCVINLYALAGLRKQAGMVVEVESQQRQLRRPERRYWRRWSSRHSGSDGSHSGSSGSHSRSGGS